MTDSKLSDYAESQQLRNESRASKARSNSSQLSMVSQTPRFKRSGLSVLGQNKSHTVH